MRVLSGLQFCRSSRDVSWPLNNHVFQSCQTLSHRCLYFSGATFKWAQWLQQQNLIQCETIIPLVLQGWCAWHCMTFGTVLLADLDSSEFEDLSSKILWTGLLGLSFDGEEWEEYGLLLCLSNVSGKHFDFGALHAFSGTMLAPTKAGTLQQ